MRIDKIHKSWKPIIEFLRNDKELEFLYKEVLPNIEYYPNVEDIFNVFQMPVDEIKVVILGQDPYPNKGQAIGYAFAVANGIRKPVSLKNIEKEVGVEIDETFLNWREQGVFMLNTALTVEAKNAGSHLKYWSDFIQKVISFISENVKPIWILWGAKAQKFKTFIETPHVINDFTKGDFNYILEAPHPAAEAYAGGKAGFFGCNHFKLINEILKLNNKNIINW